MTRLCVLAESAALVSLLLAALLYVLRFHRPELQGRLTWGRWGLAIGSALLAVGLVSHGTRGNGPLGDFANVSFVFALLLALALWWADRRAARPALAATLAPLTFLVALAGLLGSSRTLPELHGSLWLNAHILLALTAYACFAVALAAAISYLVADQLLKRKHLERLPHLPPLETSDRLGRRAVLIGWCLFTVGLLIGALTVYTWGAGFDPQIPPALATWTTYTVYLVLRHLHRWRGRRLQWLLVLGFALVGLTFALGHSPEQLQRRFF